MEQELRKAGDLGGSNARPRFWLHGSIVTLSPPLLGFLCGLPIHLLLLFIATGAFAAWRLRLTLMNGLLLWFIAWFAHAATILAVWFAGYPLTTFTSVAIIVIIFVDIHSVSCIHRLGVAELKAQGRLD